MQVVPMTLTVISYNILADAYVRPDYYPNTPPAALRPAERRAALLDHLEHLAADVLCLQEVQDDAYPAICARLAASQSRFAHKTEGKPDGCATLVAPRLPLHQTHTLSYADNTGHVALLVAVELDGRRLGIANTHLRWDPPQTAPAEQVGRRQLGLLLEAVERFTPRCHGWIVCGDFNATPSSALLQAAHQHGFLDPYADQPAPTCNSNRAAKRIDYLIHSPTLTCQPHPLPPIDDQTPLPSATQPSDHLAIGGTFAWRNA